MIEVKLIKDNNLYKSVFINGHANMDEKGKDLVCAAVTSLSMTLINYFLEFVAIKEEDLNLYIIENEEASLISLDIQDKNLYSLDKVQNGFSFFEIGIKSLMQDHSKYVELIYREV